MASILIDRSTTLHRFASLRIDFESVPRRHCIMLDRLALICSKIAPMSRQLAPVWYRDSIDSHLFASIILRFASTLHKCFMNLASISHRCTWIHLDVSRFRTDIVSTVVRSASIRIVDHAPSWHQLSSISYRFRSNIAPKRRYRTDVASILHHFESVRIGFASILHSCIAICLASTWTSHPYRTH